MKKIIIAVAAGLTFFTTQASAIAGLVDIEIGAGAWGPTISGDLQYGSGATKTDLEDDLGLEGTQNSYINLRFDHFIPIVPNLRVEIQNYTTSGTGTLGSVTFGDKTFNASTDTEITLNQKDIIFYWGIPGVNALTLGIVDIEFGLDIKIIDGKIALTSTGVSEETTFNAPIPLGYVGILIDLPVIPVGLEVTMKQLGSFVKETKAKVDFTLPLPIPMIDLAIEVGMKQQTFAITDDLVKDLEFNLDNSGIFFGANVKF